MTTEEVIKLQNIAILFESINNTLKTLDKGEYQNNLKYDLGIMKKKFNDFNTRVFRKLDEEKRDTFDEKSNKILDIIELSKKIGIDVSLYLLEELDNGNLLAVDESNPAVKSQLMYLENFNKK